MEDLANMALALALTRTMLSLPYRADAAEDLDRAVRVAIRASLVPRPRFSQQRMDYITAT